MDFMNLNQIVYGGCEFGFIGVWMCQQYVVVIGYWQDKEVYMCIGVWMCQVVFKQDICQLKVCCFGDNMCEVVVIDGDKVVV